MNRPLPDAAVVAVTQRRRPTYYGVDPSIFSMFLCNISGKGRVLQKANRATDDVC